MIHRYRFRYIDLDVHIVKYIFATTVGPLQAELQTKLVARRHVKVSHLDLT